MTETEIRLILDRRFGGVLTKGSHAEDGQACALELLSVVHGIPWTDNPKATRTWDLRALNDIDVIDEIRTEHLVPVLAAFAGSLDWPLERQQAVAMALVVGTVREIVAELPMLPLATAEQCRQTKTLDEATRAAKAANCAADSASWVASTADWADARAASAARAADCAASATSAATSAAAWATASAADWAAARAADSAAMAAMVADRAAAEKVFIQACSVWLDASQASF